MSVKSFFFSKIDAHKFGAKKDPKNMPANFSGGYREMLRQFSRQFSRRYLSAGFDAPLSWFSCPQKLAEKLAGPVGYG